MSIARDIVLPPARITLMFAEKLLSDMKSEHFARKPDGVDTNHPAWVYGHLGIYPDVFLLPLIGRPELAEPADEQHNQLFGHDSKCRDDADGSIYPAMQQITARYMARTEAVLSALAETDDAAMLAPTPGDNPLRERFPIAGALINFMLGPHSMMHLGQVSAWRRAMGLGPCM